MADIHLFGQIYGPLGIAIHTKALFDTFIKYRPENCGEIKVYPLSQLFGSVAEGTTGNTEIDSRIIDDYSKNLKQRLDGVIFIYWTPDIYQRILTEFVNPNSKILKVGYFIFEWTKISRQHLDGIALMDYMVVPSNWAKQVLVDNGVSASKIIVMRYPIDAEKVKTAKFENKKYTFLMVGKVEKRKNLVLTLDLLWQIYKEEPSYFDGFKMALLINDFHDPKYKISTYFAEIRDAGGYDNTFASFFDLFSSLESSQVDLLFRQSAFVLCPSRSGGIELPLLHSIEAGAIPVSTDAGAPGEFARLITQNPDLLIPVSGKEWMFDDRWFPASHDWGTWATIDVRKYRSMLEDMLCWFKNGGHIHCKEYFEECRTNVLKCRELDGRYIASCFPYKSEIFRIY
jgi:glycosyltransferase involved in cell wall biosynthesis